MPEEPPATSAGTPIPFNDDLKRLGVTKFLRNGDLVQLVVGDRKIVSFNIHKREFSETMERFKQSALNGTAGLSRDIVHDIELILVHPDNGYVNYLQPSNASGKGSESGNETANITYATVYEDKTSLYEALIIEGIPVFAKISINSTEISLCTEIQVDQDNVILPLPANQYASIPYEFDSKKEFLQVEHHVKTKENLDTLFQKVKAQWNLYIDNGEEHSIMCTADTIFTYHQDKLGTTHYDYFVGENDSGKTNNLHVANRLLYRNIFTVDVTAPNLSQFLGSDRDGACTIGEDEADNLDEDRDKMRIYKSGYTTGISVHRIDISFGRVQLKLKTFGFKMLTAEELPDARIAKGLLQRCVIFYCKAGNPRYDIAEVIKPGRDKKLERLLNDLNGLRNMLIIYRLLHYYDEIPDLKLNIKNREKQLFKPTIRIFQKSTKSLREIIPAINKYLTEYRVRRANTFNAALYKTVKKLLEKEKSGELRSSLICITFKNDLHGKNIPGRSMSFECEDFKKPISQGTIIKTLKDIFGAESTKNPQDERCLKFDLKKLNKFSEMYEAPTEIKVLSVGDINSNRSITKHTKISRKSRVKSKNRLSTVQTVQTVPRHRLGSFLQSKKGNLLGKQAQKRSKSAKNSSKNRPAHTKVLSEPSVLSKRKKGVNS